MWWNEEVKTETGRKEVLGARDEVAKERCMETYKEEKVKRCIHQSKKEVNERFGSKMNQNVK